MTDSITDLLRSINSPLIVATAASNGQTGGCVVGFHSQCSIEPVRYAVWISKANHTFRVATFATHLALHFLDVADHDLAGLFGGTTGDETDKFAQVEWSPGPEGVPLLEACSNRIVLRRHTMWDDGSDHVCFVGEPVEVAVGDRPVTPMRLRDADDIEAGHSAEGRPVPKDLTQTEERTLEDIAAGAGHPVDLGEPG